MSVSASVYDRCRQRDEFWGSTYQRLDEEAFRVEGGLRSAVLSLDVDMRSLFDDRLIPLEVDLTWTATTPTQAGKRDDLTHIFVVTDSEATFQQVIGELPRSLGCTQLYEDYLHNFQINTRGRR